MRAFPGGLPNLHIAVVTSDLGAGPRRCSSLRARRQGRAFHTSPHRLPGPTGSFIDESNNERPRTIPGRSTTRSRASRTSGPGLRPRAPARVAGGGPRLSGPRRRRMPAFCAGRVPRGRLHHQRGRLLGAARHDAVRFHVAAEQPLGPLFLPLQRIRSRVRRRRAAAQRDDAGDDRRRLPFERSGLLYPVGTFATSSSR